MPPHLSHRIFSLANVMVALALLGACGGGGGSTSAGTGPIPSSCEAGPRKVALSSYFDDSYFWYRLSPRPDPNSAATVNEHFRALLYNGSDGAFPADRWSYFDSTANFTRFFEDGQSLGYGVSVAGLEVVGRPDLPLVVRYVAPLSPAAAAGVVRGDRILSLNAKPVADVIRDNDFGALNAASVGDALTLTLAGAAGSRTLTLIAAIYKLVPVTNQAVLTTPTGRRVGYLAVKDMISQATQPVADALAGFGVAGVTELVLDLRYNGGGLVTVGRDIASLIAGSRGSGRSYAALRYNDKQAAARNASYFFGNPAQSLNLQRVYILVGERTCSASEQLASGLRPVVEVVLVGDTTCGKPVGFLPHDDGCGRTYSVVNFESVNALGEGRYFDGLRPHCAVAEDWTQPLGVASEPLLATALSLADGASCVAPSAADRKRALGLRGRGAVVFEGDRPAMIDR